MDVAEAIELEALSLQDPMNSVIDRGDSEVQQFYKDSVVFLTGGAGFLGKQLTEKLIRSTAVRKVYLLLRPKKGVNVQDRLTSVLSDPVFDLVREKKPGSVDKIVAMEGDIAQLRLGLSEQDYDILVQEVSFIFHMAATVRFDAHIKVATLTNVRGTREVITLARGCKHLKCLVHVSTAYTHATLSRVDSELKEQFYPVPIQPGVMIGMAEHMNEDRLADMMSSLIKDWFNTYTFTKALAEELVRTSTDGLPVCVVRPPIVFPSYYEPAPGWTDTSVMFAGCGLILGMSLGMIHVYLCELKYNCNVVPVDLINNAVMVAPWYSTRDVTQTEQHHPPIYTLSSHRRHDLTYGYMKYRLRSDEMRRLTPPLAMWYCFSFITNNVTFFWLLTWLFHYIPAYIIDVGLKLCGVKIPHVPSMVHLYTKIYKAFSVLSPYQLKRWDFMDDNLTRMISCMSDTDRLIYNCDVTNLDLDKYISIFFVGLRKYILKDGLKGSDKACRKQKILFYANIVLLMLYVCMLCMIVYYLFMFVKYIVNSFISLKHWLD